MEARDEHRVLFPLPASTSSLIETHRLAVLGDHQVLGICLCLTSDPKLGPHAYASSTLPISWCPSPLGVQVLQDQPFLT